MPDTPSIPTRLLGLLVVALAAILFWYSFSMADYAGNKALEFFTAAVQAGTAPEEAAGLPPPAILARPAAPGNIAPPAGTPQEDKTSQAVIQHITKSIQDARNGNAYAGDTQRIRSVTTGANAFTLHSSFVLAIASFLCLVAGGGIMVSGDPFWLLLDSNTKCTSLSRTQAILWTAVILGAYSTVSFFNIAFGSLAAMAAKTPYSVFPQVDSEILLLLGIVAGSPIAATYISGQSQTPSCPSACGPVSITERLTQLFKNDDSENCEELQLSRMQCIFMTIILVVCYVSLLLQYTGSIDADMLACCVAQHPAIPALPSITGSFMILLTASHTIFQVSKSNWAKQFRSPPPNQPTGVIPSQPGTPTPPQPGTAATGS